jgi:hypothetical protein
VFYIRNSGKGIRSGLKPSWKSGQAAILAVSPGHAADFRLLTIKSDSEKGIQNLTTLHNMAILLEETVNFYVRSEK